MPRSMTRATRLVKAAPSLHRQFFRGGKKVALLRFRLFGDVKRPAVFALEFENARSMAERNLLYMEGQYLYLNCPHVSKWEWHPFTISSAPDDEVLTVNIRVMPDAASWTSKVCRYLQKLNPHDQPSVVLSRRDQATGALADGKVRGPDGKILFRIDGPFGAPAQHFFNYRVAMLVGAGIGVTPFASILRGLVRYHWIKGFKPAHIHFYWVARKTDVLTFRWLLLMLPGLKRLEHEYNQNYTDPNAVVAARERLAVAQASLAYVVARQREQLTPSEADAAEVRRVLAEVTALEAALEAETAKRRELHVTLFLTGTTDDELRAIAEKAGTTDVRAPGLHRSSVFDEAEGDDAAMLGASSDELLGRLLALREAETGAPALRAIAGRPKWDSEFDVLRRSYRETIGVVFCGAAPIAAQLQKCCRRFSSGATTFRLHKENF